MRDACMMHHVSCTNGISQMSSNGFRALHWWERVTGVSLLCDRTITREVRITLVHYCIIGSRAKDEDASDAIPCPPMFHLASGKGLCY